MTSLPTTSDINLNYMFSLQVIIPIKLLVCNFAVNYLRNSPLSCCPTGLTRRCLSIFGHHETDELRKSSSENRHKLSTTPQKVQHFH